MNWGCTGAILQNILKGYLLVSSCTMVVRKSSETPAKKAKEKLFNASQKCLQIFQHILRNLVHVLKSDFSNWLVHLGEQIVIKKREVRSVRSSQPHASSCLMTTEVLWDPASMRRRIGPASKISDSCIQNFQFIRILIHSDSPVFCNYISSPHSGCKVARFVTKNTTTEQKQMIWCTTD